jgi:hypothetical protein
MELSVTNVTQQLYTIKTAGFFLFEIEYNYLHYDFVKTKWRFLFWKAKIDEEYLNPFGAIV